MICYAKQCYAIRGHGMLGYGTPPSELSPQNTHGTPTPETRPWAPTRRGRAQGSMNTGEHPERIHVKEIETGAKGTTPPILPFSQGEGACARQTTGAAGLAVQARAFSKCACEVRAPVGAQHDGPRLGASELSWSILERPEAVLQPSWDDVGIVLACDRPFKGVVVPS